MSYNTKISKLLTKLLEEHNNLPLCQHLGLALGDYKSIEFVNNKSLSLALQSYIEQLDLESSFKFQDSEEDFVSTEEF